MMHAVNASIAVLAIPGFRVLSRPTPQRRTGTIARASRALKQFQPKCRPEAPAETISMSRTTSSSLATFTSTTEALRSGLRLAIVTSLLFAARSQAQQVTPGNTLQVRPVVGALVATGDHRDVLKDAVLVGAQAAFAFHSNFALVGSFGWSPSTDKATVGQPKVDVYEYDLGLEGRLDNLTPGSRISTQPYAAIGAGGRTYDLRDTPNSSAETNALGYGAIGLDLNQAAGPVGVRIEARDNVTGFKGLKGELIDRVTRNDLQFSAGLTFRF
jgi:hypothetical protein